MSAKRDGSSRRDLGSIPRGKVRDNFARQRMPNNPWDAEQIDPKRKVNEDYTKHQSFFRFSFGESKNA